MKRDWTFGRKLGLGFTASALLTVLMGCLAVYALRTVVSDKDHVIEGVAQTLVEAEILSTLSESKAAAARAYLLTGSDEHLAEMKSIRNDFDDVIKQLKASASAPEAATHLEAVERAEHEHRVALDSILELRKSGAPVDEIGRRWNETVAAKRVALAERVAGFVTYQEQRLVEARTRSTAKAARAIWLVVLTALVAVIAAAVLATLLTRTLGTQIGTSVSQVQSSSSELQAAATQQVTGAREHATAMNEIATTISELLATSRQIAESAQRVARVADDTVAAARTGDATVEKTFESIATIRQQIDAVVTHMLDLGRRSQQIGAVLDIVSELAEQTNILAINATIEAAGAGDAGKRFAVVADEIRKLADRVAASTKEIRGLIEDVRSAVNTTVMATENGSKAVDAGTKQFGDVASAFKQIVSLISTTTEAAREIVLSTKQQSTAVEQVNLAIANITQVTRDSEASSVQTLQTASQLAELSRMLMGLIRPQPVS